MLPQSASKYTSLENLRQAQLDNCLGATGIEYIQEDLDAMIAEKCQRRADAQLRLWVNPSQETPSDDGMIDILNCEETMPKKEENMPVSPVSSVRGISIVSDDCAISPAIPMMIDASETRRMRSEIEVVVSEMHGFRAELMTAKGDIEDMAAEMRKIANTAQAPKVMHVNIDGCKNKLTRPASPYLARMLVQAKAGINTMLVGPSQCGKSTMAGQLAEALGVPVYRIVMGECLSDGAIWGRRCPVSGAFIPGPAYLAAKNGGLLVVEELDMGDANGVGQLNALFDDSVEVYCRMSNEIIQKHEKLYILATANSTGRGADFVYTGRNRLDAATLKRFVPVIVDYDRALESDLCPDTELLATMHTARDRLVSRKAKEFITTKDIRNAHVLKTNGIDMADIIASMTLGWPADLVTQAFEEKKAPSASVTDVDQGAF